MHAGVETGRRPRTRGAGEGSIGRHASGRWRARLMVGHKADGTLDVREVYGKTQREARLKLEELKRRAAGTLGTPSMERATVATFLDAWLEAAKPTVRASTHDRYADYVRLHTKPTLGALRLAALTPPVLQQLYARKLAQGLSPRLVQHLHRVLHRACHQAVRWGYLAGNPVDRADPPRVPTVERHPPSGRELAALVSKSAAAGDRSWARYVVAACSGCRQGELLGPQWRDVDLERGTLTVRRALVKAAQGAPTFAEPKTAGSRRTVHLPDEAILALRRHRQRQLEERLHAGPDYAPYELVFCTQVGTPLRMSNLFRAFKAALARAGLPRTRPCCWGATRTPRSCRGASATARSRSRSTRTRTSRRRSTRTRRRSCSG